MKFHGNVLTEYKCNDFNYVQKFAEYAFQLQRLDRKDLDIISANQHYKADFVKTVPDNGMKWV